MGKKPFTTRIDDKVLEVAQRLADSERRSVTSLIEVAVLEYEKRGAAPDAVQPPGVSSVIPALVAFYRQDEADEDTRPDQVVWDVAEAVGNAISALHMLDAEYVPETVVSAFGGRSYIEAISVWRRACGEHKIRRGKGKGEPPAPPALPL
jgi:hypothetical protein